MGRSEIQQLAVGENDIARIGFSPGGNQTNPGAAGPYYSALWLSGVLNSLEIRVSDAGALEYTQGPPAGPGPARWPATTRFNNPVFRVAANTSLVLRGPGDNYAEFFTRPRAGFQLCDPTGAAWPYMLNSTNNAIVPQPVVSLVAQQARIGDPTWFRSDGRTIIGSGRGHGGSVQVASYSGEIQCKWNGLASFIQFQSGNGLKWNVQPDAAGVLQVTAG